MNRTKKNLGFLLVISIIVMSIPYIYPVYSATLDGAQKTLAFLENVIGVDVSNYNVVKLGPFLENPDFLGGLTLVYGGLDLTSGASKIEVDYKYVNGSMSYCLAQVRTGSLIYIVPPPVGLRDTAKDFMDKYSVFLGDSSLNTMTKMLDTVDLTKSTSVVEGDVKLNTSISSTSNVLFEWYNLKNNVAYSSINVKFVDGQFYALNDDRSYVQSGGAYVNVSEDQALNIALSKAATFSYSYGGNGISGFNIVKSQIRSELLAKGRDNVLVLYPYWKVTLPLDHYYPGSVSCIIVEVWADTSAVIRVYPLGTDIGAPETPVLTASAMTYESPSPSVSTKASSSFSLSPSSTSVYSPVPTASPSSITQPTSSNAIQTTDNLHNSASPHSSFLIAIAVFACVVAAIVLSYVIAKNRK